MLYVLYLLFFLGNCSENLKTIIKPWFDTLFRQHIMLNLTCLFLVSGEKSVQKAFHSQQRGNPHSCANGRWLSQIQDYSGQREVGAWEQWDRLVNQVFPCEQKSWLIMIISIKQMVINDSRLFFNNSKIRFKNCGLLVFFLIYFFPLWENVRFSIFLIVNASENWFCWVCVVTCRRVERNIWCEPTSACQVWRLKTRRGNHQSVSSLRSRTSPPQASRYILLTSHMTVCQTMPKGQISCKT